MRQNAAFGWCKHIRHKTVTNCSRNGLAAEMAASSFFLSLSRFCWVRGRVDTREWMSHNIFGQPLRAYLLLSSLVMCGASQQQHQCLKMPRPTRQGIDLNTKVCIIKRAFEWKPKQWPREEAWDVQVGQFHLQQNAKGRSLRQPPGTGRRAESVPEEWLMGMLRLLC